MSDARQQVLDVLAEMLMTNSVQKLSLQDLLREADVNRSTFYYHFRSLADACDPLIEEALSPIDEFQTHSREATETSFEQVLFDAQYLFFTYCKEHSRLYHALLWGDLRDRFLTVFVERMEQRLAACIRIRLSEDLPGRGEYDDSAYHMFLYRSRAYQQFSILEAWATHEFERSPELVAKFTSLVVPPDPKLCTIEVKRSSRTYRWAPSCR